MRWLLFLFVMLSHISASMFANAFGGSGDDKAYSIQETSDGGYIVAGITDSYGAGGHDFLILKLNSTGDLEWARTIDLASYISPADNFVRSVQQTQDKGYILAGWNFSQYRIQFWDFGVVKLDSSGNVEWARELGGPYSWGYAIQQTSDTGYIVAGYTYIPDTINPVDDFLIIKLDSQGNTEWARTLGIDTLIDKPYSVQQTSDNGYIVAGESGYGTGNSDFLIIKLTFQGNLEWAYTFGGAGDDVAHSVQQTSDGGYIIAGETKSYGSGNNDFLVIKLNSQGNLEWAYTLGGAGDDIAHSVQQTSDGGYVVAGATNSYGAGGNDFLIIKLNSQGNLEWACTLGDTIDDFAYSIHQTSDSGYIVAGATNSYGAGGNDFLILKIGSNGVYPNCVYECFPSFDSPSISINSASIVISDSLPGNAPTSKITTSPIPIVTEVCAPGIEENQGFVEASKFIYLDAIPLQKNTFQIKYKIFSEKKDVLKNFLVSLKLFDTSGMVKMVLFEGYRASGIYTNVVNLDKLSAGIYFLRLKVNGQSVQKKLRVF